MEKKASFELLHLKKYNTFACGFMYRNIKF